MLWQKLPTEVAVEVCRSLDQPDLVALSKTCRMSRAVTERQRFKDVSFDGQRYEFVPSLCYFLRSLHDNSTLARQVESVSVTMKLDAASAPQEYERFYSLALEGAGLDRRAKPDSILSCFHPLTDPGRGLVMLLLRACTSLRSLSMDNTLIVSPDSKGFPEHTTTPHFRMHRFLIATLPTLQQLTTLSIFDSSTDKPLDMFSPLFKILLRLPRLQSLRVCIYGGAGKTDSDWMCEDGRIPHSDSLKELLLPVGFVHLDHVPRLLVATPNLEKLELRIDRNGEDFTWGYHWPVNLNALGDHLRKGLVYTDEHGKQSSHLRHLGLSALQHVPWAPPTGRFKGCLGSLQGFQNLEYLSISRLMLLGSQVKSSPPLNQILPKSLRTLIFGTQYYQERDYLWNTYYAGWNSFFIFDRVQPFAADWESSPRLERLMISDVQSDEEGFSDRWDSLDALCRQRNIMLEEAVALQW